VVGAAVGNRVKLVVLTAALVAWGVFGFAATATAAPAKQFGWLCKPGISKDPCPPSLKTSVLSNTGEVQKVKNIKPTARPKIDCFYVYPTVSDQKTANANLHIDPEERSIALYQVARYSQYCRVFAPVYRQITVTQLDSGTSTITPHMSHVAYGSALAAWKQYLGKLSDGRDFVLIGHSQGSFVLRKLIASQIDPNPALRSRMLSAILLGGNVNGDLAFSKRSKDRKARPGDFENIKPCKSASQLHCVMGFSTFNAPVPSDALFGRTTLPDHKVLCTNPAALGGGSARLESIVPSAPFAPGTTIGYATLALGFPQVDVTTPFYEYDHAYDGTCSSADGASVLQVSPRPGAATLNAVPDASWGLHLADANIAQGNLVDVVGQEIHALAKRGG
jgi:hypothetical protein